MTFLPVSTSRSPCEKFSAIPVLHVNSHTHSSDVSKTMPLKQFGGALECAQPLEAIWCRLCVELFHPLGPIDTVNGALLVL